MDGVGAYQSHIASPERVSTPGMITIGARLAATTLHALATANLVPAKVESNADVLGAVVARSECTSFSFMAIADLLLPHSSFVRSGRTSLRSKSQSTQQHLNPENCLCCTCTPARRRIESYLTPAIGNSNPESILLPGEAQQPVTFSGRNGESHGSPPNRHQSREPEKKGGMSECD